MKYSKINKDDVLKFLCTTCGYPCPAHFIAEIRNTSMYQVRKNLKQLKEEGYVKIISISVGDDFNLPYRGFHITDKTRETEIYKQASKKEDEYWRSI